MTFPDLALYLDHVIEREGRTANDNVMPAWERDLEVIRRCLNGDKAVGVFTDEIDAPAGVILGE